MQNDAPEPRPWYSRPFRRPLYDKSEKEFEVLRIDYTFDKNSRKLICKAYWYHHRYYRTLRSALDAVRDFRNSWYDKVLYDIDPKALIIRRYKAVRRHDKP